jgi:protoporphyrinogen oxidase
LVREGKLHCIDTSRPIAAFLKMTALSWPEKFRLIRGGLKFLKATKGISLTDVLGHTQYDTESISQFLSRHFDKNLIDTVFDPLARVVTLGDKDDTSCLELFAGLVAANSELVNVTGGLETLPLALAAQVPVQLNARVTAVKKTNSEVAVTYELDGGSAAPRTETADACVITSTFVQAVEMDPALALAGAALAQRKRSAPCYVVHLGYAAQTRANPYVVTIPSTESPHISAIFLEHNKAPDRAPEGHSLIMVYYCPASVPVVSTWSPEQMLADSQARIESLFPELKGTLEMHNIQFIDRASHYGPVGYYRDVKAFLDQHPASDPIQIAGDYLSIPGQETAVSWGLRAAEALITGRRQ